MVEICVVSCCFCQTFQGQQVKKEKKWTCKMCGEKQSFRKIFAQGSGKECRQHVQKLNMMKGKVNKEEGNVDKQEEEQFGQKTEQIGRTIDQVNHDDIPVRKLTLDSKWQQFIGSEKEIEEDGSESDPETFTTERGIFNKHKTGQKRKKSNTQTALEELGFPTKMQKNNSNPMYRSSPGHSTLNNIKTTEIYSKSFNTTDVINQLPQTNFECNLKENEIQLQTLASECQNKTIACRQRKASKWSQYT